MQIRLAFSIAEEREIIPRNIMEASDMRCPKFKKADKKIRGYTLEDQKLLEQAIKEHRVPDGRNSYKRQLLLELYTGMRIGEINAICEKHKIYLKIKNSKMKKKERDIWLLLKRHQSNF